VLSSAAALLDELFEHPAGWCSLRRRRSLFSDTSGINMSFSIAC